MLNRIENALSTILSEREGREVRVSIEEDKNEGTD